MTKRSPSKNNTQMKSFVQGLQLYIFISGFYDNVLDGHYSEPLLAFTRVELLRMHGRGLHSEMKLLKINK